MSIVKEFLKYYKEQKAYNKKLKSVLDEADTYRFFLELSRDVNTSGVTITVTKSNGTVIKLEPQNLDERFNEDELFNGSPYIKREERK